MQNYGPEHPYFVLAGAEEGVAPNGGMMHGLNFVDVMEWLYDLTGDQAYRDFGVWLFNDYCSVPGHFPLDDMKLQYVLNLDIPYNAHAAHTAEHLRLLIWSYHMTGRADMKTGIKNAFAKLARYNRTQWCPDW